METMIGGTTATIPPRGTTTRTTGPKAGDNAFAGILETAQRKVEEPGPGTAEPDAATDPGPEPSSASDPEATSDVEPTEDTLAGSENAKEATDTGPSAEDQAKGETAVEAKAGDTASQPADQGPAASTPADGKAGDTPVATGTPVVSVVTGLLVPDAAAGVIAAQSASAESAAAAGSSPEKEPATVTAALPAGPTVALLPVVAEGPKPSAEPEAKADAKPRSDQTQATPAAKTPVLVPAMPTPAATQAASPTASDPAAAPTAATTSADPQAASPAAQSGQASAGHGQPVTLGPGWTPAADLASAAVPLSSKGAGQTLSSLDDAGSTGLLSLHEWLDPRLTAEPAPGQLLERLQQAVGQARAATFDEVARTVLPQVTRGIATLVQDGSAEMRLHLRPPELGEIELRVRATDSTVQGQVTVQQPVVKHLLESQLGRLREALSSQGLQLTGFDVNVNRDPRSAPDRERGTGPGAGARISRTESTPVVETTAAPMRVGGGLHAVDYTI